MPSIVSDILALIAPNPTYTLLKKFNVPTGHGLRAAVAVTFETSKTITSLYTLLLKTIGLEIWYMVVLLVVALSAKKVRSHNVSIVVIVWNAQSSPLDIIKLMFGYVTHTPQYALMWIALAALAWASSTALSLLATRDLIINLSAPLTGSYALRLNQITTPANLRAIGAADNLTANANVSVSASSPTTDASGNIFYTVDYGYTISDVDFGLQNASGLLLSVTGSCFTDYTWYNGTYNESGTLEDNYLLFGSQNPSDSLAVSIADGGPPLAFFLLPPEGPIGSNASYAIIISSLYRKSFTEGIDPWYATMPLPGDRYGAEYQVAPGRPVLNCWENDIWSYQGNSSSTADLEYLGALPLSLATLFQRFLSAPRIINLGQALGTTALKSATGTQGYYFDAQSSSLHNDLERLVLGAYQATKNTLQELTQFSTQYSDIGNIMLNNDSMLLPGADLFVIYTPDAAALSLAMVIAVPIIAALLLGINLLLTTNYFPWGYVNSLKAAVIYSALDEKDTNTSRWDRSSTAPVYKDHGDVEGAVQTALVRPGLDRKRRTLS
ncbi:uncharacterized protein K444DRAFT_722448 [Hyaloscypha bicolor E]|uniref:Uncharacterized protein n=1 Tax=Hyaloscypha bicolor E TaxID=1095630 RepID=A0A2J6T9V1_9HELO|nr:uncharacterized protein K444DRAFT_722448 [Hyaloscypha bicolor E]PMD59789.1 hypothetical protein K444DRAFT_722448 [Hyaloscypha bicolor E]